MAPRILRRRLLPALFLTTASLAVAADASAQLPTDLRDGRRALSFGAFVGGGGMIGATFMLGSRTAFTLDVQGDAIVTSTDHESDGIPVSERETLSVEALLAPGFRRYMAGRGDVASYIAGRLLLGVEGVINEIRFETSQTRTERWSPMAGAALGFGLEWFVTDAMSIRGEAALEGTYTRSTETGPDPSGSEEFTSHVIRTGLGQSGLAVSIWF